MFQDHKNRMGFDIAVPAEFNVSLKILQNLLKYKDLELEIGKIWQMKKSIIPIMVSSLSSIGKGFDWIAEEICSGPCLKEIQQKVQSVLYLRMVTKPTACPAWLSMLLYYAYVRQKMFAYLFNWRISPKINAIALSDI